MIPSLIGLTGRMGSGKSFAAQYLNEKYGYEVLKFAGPLKDMLRSFGLTEDHIEGKLKELPCDLLCGKTPRFAMQTLGTEWGRDIIGGDLWGGMWQHKAQEMMDSGRLVVTDDVRFFNEAQRIKSMGGIVISLSTPNEPPAATHSSEINETVPSVSIVNDMSIEGGLEKTLDFIIGSVAAATYRKNQRSSGG